MVLIMATCYRWYDDADYKKIVENKGLYVLTTNFNLTVIKFLKEKGLNHIVAIPHKNLDDFGEILMWNDINLLDVYSYLINDQNILFFFTDEFDAVSFKIKWS